MCAIAGIFDLFYDDAVIKDMLSTMQRRGPDAMGIVRDPDACMLHARLAVIDPKGGLQPMELEWEGERYVICYNGELYNTQELKEELKQYGHEFTTSSDTEVILHAYCQWQDASLEKMNGIFAFAVWESKRRRLFLARDRMGVKPLFYTHHRGGLLFGSEIKTLLAYPSVEASIDAQGVSELLLIGPGRTPGSGVFHNIYELQPGHCAYYEDRVLTVRRYWYLQDREHTDSFEQTVQYVRYLVIDAIQRQMVSDVPLGAFLSGGLDSSLICAVCNHKMKQSGKKLDTFSLDYRDNEKYYKPEKFQPNSDAAYVEIMEKELASNPHRTILETGELYSLIKDATLARDLPGMADVDASLLAFCGEIRHHVKVALSGECADEIFGGYPWFRDPEVRQKEGFPWAQNTKQRIQLIHPQWRETIDPEEFISERYFQTIRESDILPKTKPEERRMKEMVNLNQRWFMQTLLDRKDRMSMYHGLEVRVPFCDYRIAEYLYAVPWKFKNYKDREKGLLRIAMAGLLPESILWRKKSPYPKTYDPHYFQLVCEGLNEIIQDKDAPLLNIVSKEALIKLLGAEYAWPWYGQLMRVPQTVAYMLQINFWMEEYKIKLI